MKNADFIFSFWSRLHPTVGPPFSGLQRSFWSHQSFVVNLFLYCFRSLALKITGETLEVRSDKRKPREEREDREYREESKDRKEREERERRERRKREKRIEKREKNRKKREWEVSVIPEWSQIDPRVIPERPQSYQGHHGHGHTLIRHNKVSLVTSIASKGWVKNKKKVVAVSTIIASSL